MLDGVRRFLSPPAFEDEEESRTAHLLNAILRTSWSLSIAFLIIIPIVSPNPAFSLVMTGLLLAPQVVAQILLRRRRVRIASMLLASMLWLIITLSAVFAGGVRSASFGVLTPVILVAGLLLGWRVGAVFIGMSILAGSGMLYAESEGLLPQPLIANTTVSLWVAQTAGFIAAAALLYLAIRSIASALERARRNEVALAASYRELEAEVAVRERTEEALRESEEKYRLLVENANEGVVVAQDGMLKFFNPEVLRVTGYSEEELAVKPFPELIHPADREMVVERYMRRLQGGAAPYSYPFRIVDKAGETKWVDLNVVVLSWEGRPAVLCFLDEITERRRLEEQLRQAQKMEAIGTLAGGIAHDFNNILTGILGTASLMQQDIAPDGPLYADIGGIIRSAKHAADLTRQLLTFARRDPQAARGSLNLNAVVHEVVGLLERTIDRAISIETHLADDLQPVEGDASQLHQMLLNLCLNARDAMPQGGKLIVETWNAHVSAAEARHALDIEAGEYVLLSVTDTGTGMDMSVQERIFEPFFSTKEEGQGLGLSIVYGIVRGHRGSIHVYTEPRVGTTFKVYLPADPIPRDVSVVTETAAPGGSEVVLVVDDEESVRRVLKRMLERGGYTVLLAEDGVQAIDLYRERGAEIDLVILDLIMPGMRGHEACSRLLEIEPEVKVLLTSGHSENGQAVEILVAGAQGFLQKPYDIEAVLAKVRQMLDFDA